MINLSKGLSFEDYLEKSTVEQRQNQMNSYKNTSLSEEFQNKIREINNGINIAVFSEGFCPDCIVTLPFIKRMEELNSNINVKIFPRSGNEKLLEQYTGVSRIPTVMAFTSNMEPKGAYIEFPEELTNMMINLDGDRRKKLIEDYRNGKYNYLIEKELLKIIK